MANTMRWRYGATKPVQLPVASATVIEIGDLVYLDFDNAKPAGEQGDQGSVTGNQETFHDNFVGVAMQASPAGESEPIRVATSGVFEFECASATFEVGDLVGGSENGAGNALESQVVEGVAAENLALGRCVSRVNPAAERVLLEIESTVVTGGPQAAA